jgi:hypothetical protein
MSKLQHSLEVMGKYKYKIIKGLERSDGFSSSSNSRSIVQ